MIAKGMKTFSHIISFYCQIIARSWQWKPNDSICLQNKHTQFHVLHFRYLVYTFCTASFLPLLNNIYCMLLCRYLKNLRYTTRLIVIYKLRHNIVTYNQLQVLQRLFDQPLVNNCLSLHCGHFGLTTNGS